MLLTENVSNERDTAHNSESSHAQEHVVTQATPSGLTPVHAWLNEQSEWVLTSLGKTHFLIPQFMVQALSHIPKNLHFVYEKGILKPTQNTSSNKDDAHYIATNSEFAPLEHIPTSRFIATRITSPLGEAVNWCWDDVKMLEKHNLPFFELPKRLRSSNTPFQYATEIPLGTLSKSADTSNSQAELALYANMDALYQYVTMLHNSKHTRELQGQTKHTVTGGA